MGAYERQPLPEGDCPPDIFPVNNQTICGDGNGTINAGDLGELLASWGPCPGGGNPCCEDLFLPLNGNVGYEDLAQLLANWGPCPESLAGDDSDEMSLDDAVMTLGFEDVVDFIDWCMSNDNAEVYAMAMLLYELLTADASDK